MWEFLMGIFIGDALRRSPFRALIQLALKLLLIGILLAGFIYTYVVFKAVAERSHPRHVQTQRTR